MSETKTAVVISGPAEYSFAKGFKKAIIQAAMEAGTAFVAVLATTVADPAFQAQLIAMAKDKPWAPLMALGLRVGVGMLVNWQKNKDPKALIEAATVEPTAVAAATSVQSQLDRKESPAPAVVLTDHKS